MKDKKVELREIKDLPVEIYSPDGTLIGTTDNMLTFQDFRIQVAEQRLQGYYVMFQGERIDVDICGGLRDWPNGLFDVNENQLHKLLDLWWK